MSNYKTPLRYPGGKQRLTPFVLEVLQENDLVGGDYAEPYAGGAGVAIALLLDGHVGRIHLNDSCTGVYAFWRSILNKTDEFCQRVTDTPLTIKEWRRQKEILSRPSEFDQIDVGFSTFYLNRCNRSGILSGGVIGGLNQKGKWKIDARFPRKELIARIEAIAKKRRCITVKNLDAQTFISDYLPTLPDRTLVYCDPPYFHKANRLYLNHYKPKDHATIARVIQTNIQQHWMVSYDGAPEILKCYSERRSFIYDLQYNAAKAYKGIEVFFFSDALVLPRNSSIPSISSALQSLH